MIVSQVECDLRKEVLRRMQETKQSHFNDVLNGYTGTEEEGRGRLTPDISLESKVCIPHSWYLTWKQGLHTLLDVIRPETILFLSL